MILKGEIGRGDVALLDGEGGRVAVDVVREKERGRPALAFTSPST
jgi:hypothetical protein